MTYRKVLNFWLPLAFAWLLMTFEAPLLQSVVSRKPDSEIQLAAFGLVFSLSILIETPVIMLLATSNALAQNRQSYQVLWRFMMAINILLTGVAVLMAFTPLLDLYLGVLLNIPAHIIEATRPGMRIMILWSAFIGYRRFHQGIIIRFGSTRYVGYGTLMRVLISGGIAIGLGAMTQMAGAAIGALSLVFAVGIEALYTHFVSRPDVRQLLATPLRGPAQPLTYRDALRFHLPLAATSVIAFLIGPIIERGLANMPDATQSLAAWPIIFFITLFLRSGGMAYQEVVISLNRSQQHHHTLRRFTYGLGLGLSFLMMIFAFTPLIEFYNHRILDVPDNLHGLVILGVRAGVMLPLLAALQSYLRALLMLSQKTTVIYQAMILGFALTAAIVWGGIEAGMHGILVASLGLTIGQTIELGFMVLVYRRQNAPLQLHWQAAVAASAGD